MATGRLIPVDSKRFDSWFYDEKKFELYVKFPATQKKPGGSIVCYSSVTPEVFEEGNEAESKGQWLGDEIIANPIRYPFRYINAAQPAPKQEGPIIDSPLVPEAIRMVAELPVSPLTTMPEILPPEVADGEKPFNQLMRERAKSIAAAVPRNYLVTNADSYRALGTALVVIQTERRSIEKFLEGVIRPLVEAKRNFDSFRNEILAWYNDSEQHLNKALLDFRKAEERRVREEEERVRRQNQERARQNNEAAAAARRKEAEQNLTQAEQHVHERITVAQETIQKSSDPRELSQARKDIEEAHKDLVNAQEVAALPVSMMPAVPAPVIVAKPDLKVAGLRAKAPLWRWKIPDRHFRSPELSTLVPVRRTSLVNPTEIPDEYWILDEKAVGAHVKSMDGVCSIPQVETYDLNNS